MEIKVKPTKYKRKGKLVIRKGYSKELTYKQRMASKKNMEIARKKWVKMSNTKKLKNKIKR